MTKPQQKREVQAALSLLLDAYDCAQETEKDAWDFAVEISRLRGLGINDTDCRWLTSMGFVQHGLELTLLGDNQRTFHPVGPFKFEERSCFALTPQGVEGARSASGGTGERAKQLAFEDVSDPVVLSETVGKVAATEIKVQPVVPNWDEARRELRLGGQLVKKFKRRAPHQAAILAAFQEDGWPPCVADPLSPAPDIDPKRRLNDVIKSLNRNQVTAMLRFMGNGTGEGVVWELTRINGHPVSHPTDA